MSPVATRRRPELAAEAGSSSQSAPSAGNATIVGRRLGRPTNEVPVNQESMDEDLIIDEPMDEGQATNGSANTGPVIAGSTNEPMNSIQKLQYVTPHLSTKNYVDWTARARLLLNIQRKLDNLWKEMEDVEHEDPKECKRQLKICLLLNLLPKEFDYIVTNMQSILDLTYNEAVKRLRHKEL
ncbi:MAG: hypothetical protein M1813_000653 [Trichoglossum hirsutum]|nr:MAG: hypothetical protein M1813_000653 [Trichoglossum hirsutum]